MRGSRDQAGRRAARHAAAGVERDHVRAEAIAAPRDAADRRRRGACRRSRPRHAHGARQRARRDRDARPERVEELVDRDDALALADQDAEQRERLRLDRDWSAFAPQLAGLFVELVAPEAVDHRDVAAKVRETSGAANRSRWRARAAAHPRLRAT